MAPDEKAARKASRIAFPGAASIMFLFSTPASTPEPTAKTPDHPIARVVQQAADATGISFDYLMRTAKRESGLNPAAKAPSSSATGLFQFIEQTWLGLVKREGPNLGLQAEAEAIQQDRSGRYTVNDAQARKQILDLRKDPALSSTLAGVFTQKNRETLKSHLSREPNPAELYMAHFLGAQGASDLIARAQSNPEQSAASAFPDAASANRSIFFDGKGRARSMREVYARLSSFHTGEDASAVQVAAANGATGESPMQAQPVQMQLVRGGSGAIPRLVTVTGQVRSNNTMQGLFRTGGESDGAQNLRKTWLQVSESRLNRQAPSFFPRENAPVAQVAALSSEVVNAPVSDATAEPEAVGTPAPDLPLPPRRGEAFATVQNPLDLTKFSTRKVR
jgi:hypothetical protein